MRRSAALLAATAAVATAVACSSSGGGGSGTLTTGVYETYNAAADGADACGLGLAFNVDAAALTSALLPVTVTGSQLLFGALPGTISGATLVAGFTSNLDFSLDPLHTGHVRTCTATYTVAVAGKVTGPDRADAGIAVGLTGAAGADCDQVLIDLGAHGSMPCDVSTKFSMARFGDITPTPTPVTGTINLMIGSNAGLSSTGVDGTNSTFTLEATVNGAAVVDSGKWTCFGPIPGVADYYDLIFNTSTIGNSVDVYIPSADWTVGSHPIVAGGVAIAFTFPVNSTSTYPSATGGSVILDTAPTLEDSPLSVCNFHTTGVTFSTP